MAKAKTMVVRQPSRTVQVIKAARRGASKLAEHRKSVKGMAISVATAGLLGWAEGKDVQLPKVDALGVPGTYGLVAAAIYAVTDSDVAAHMSTGLLSVAIYQAAKSGISSSGAGDGYNVETAGAVDFE
jgi:hypothetical protein